MATQEGVRALAGRILAGADEQAARIIRAAEAQAAAIRGRAEAEAEAARQATIEQAQQEAERARSRSLAQAQLQARRSLLTRREALIARALALAHERLIGSLTLPERRAALAKLTAEAATALGGGQLRVQANAEDTPLLTPAFLQEVQAAIAPGSAVLAAGPPVDIGGGAIVSKDAGRVIYDNSFEARLERSQWALRNEVWQALATKAELAPVPLHQSRGSSHAAGGA